MKSFYLFIFFSFSTFFTTAQTVSVSGECISEPIILKKIAELDGKPVFQETGIVAGYTGITVTMYWLDAPDNLWIVDFDGQPYFQCKSTTTLPPGTESKIYHWTSVAGTECTGSKPLSITGSGILSVALHSFAVRKEGNRARLLWKTASEINNRGFEIQRSVDLSNWSQIGFVNGAGNSSGEITYSFIDAAPLPGKNYYRLLQFDLDNKTTISTVANVDISQNGYYTLSNNPGNGRYRLYVNSFKNIYVSVTDMSGRRLISSKLDAGVHQIDISKYAKGTYILYLKIGNQVYTERLIKQ